jgi:DNA mismatch endonuclease, patch repair protein
MSRIRGRDTKPELWLRSRLHALGYRYRVHVRGLPGTPDVVFAARRKVIFVHGCFWHQHSECPLAVMPKTREDFWRRKLAANAARDERNVTELEALGWGVLVLWECELQNELALSKALEFLGPSRVS